MSAATHRSPLLQRRAALLQQGQQLRTALSAELDTLGNLVAQPARIREQLVGLGRAIALRGAVIALQRLALPRWVRMARLLMRAWRLWRRVRG